MGISLLLLALSEELGVLGSLLLVLGSTSTLEGEVMTLALETLWGDKTLDLGCLVTLLLACQGLENEF